MSNNLLRKYALKNESLIVEITRLKNNDEKTRLEMEKMKKEIKILKEKIKKMNTVQKGRFEIITRNINSRSNSLTSKEKKEKFSKDIKKPLK